MKLKRLVSAVLAVGMALTILPTAVFATLSTTQITEIKLKDGMFDPVASGGKEGTNGFAQMSSDNGASWGLWPNGALDLNGVFSESSVSSGEPMNGYQGNLINNRGTITGGKFADGSIVYNSGLITGGVFDTLSAIVGGAYTENETAYTSGAFIKKYDATSISQGTAVLKDSVVWGTLTENTDKDKNLVISGVLPAKSEHIASTSKHYEIEAPGFTMTSSYTTSAGTKYDFSIQDEMQAIGETKTPAMDITVVPSSSERKVEDLQVKGFDKDNYTINGTESVVLHVPEGYEGEIEISSVMEKFDLEASGNLPTKSKNADGSYGGTYDGWYYEEITGKDKVTKQLTIYSDYTADIGSEPVDWNVINNGTIAGGKYTGPVANYGNITGGTFADEFANYDAAKYNNTNAVREEGIVTSGVFSRSADFGTQKVKLTWLNAKNATINGIECFNMAGVVGKQTVTVETTDANFTGWVVSGDNNVTLTEEQRTSKKLTLELDGDKEQNIILTAATPENYQSFTVIDGKATNAEGETITSAKAGETVTLTANDAPDGMVFDRWEVTPTAAEAKLEGFDASSATTTFKMGTQEITIRAMYRMADVEEPNVLGTVAVVATAGVGAAVLGWTGYQLGTELYLKTALPAGTAIPTNRAELALLVWNHAGKPAPAAVLPADATDTQKAIAWAVENDLLKAAKDNGEAYADADSVSRVEVIRVWNKAQEK